MNEFEKMVKGLTYNQRDKEVVRRRNQISDLCQKFNNCSQRKVEKRNKYLRKILGKLEDRVYIRGPFYCNYGFVTIGERSFINFNCTMLDVCYINIGKNAFIGPNCGFYTAIHPIHYLDRNIIVNNDGSINSNQTAAPISIGDNCWIGGNVIVLPGVTIGDGCVIGAGSVVTHDIPPMSVAFGNPCKVHRTLADKDKIKQQIYD